MPTVSETKLRIQEGFPSPGNAVVEVTYTLALPPFIYNLQIFGPQRFVERVELVGLDAGEVSSGPTFRVLDVLYVGSVEYEYRTRNDVYRRRRQKIVSLEMLNEDPSPGQADELQAWVTLVYDPIRLPIDTAAGRSNIVTRGQPTLDPNP